jgi:hypothetical protein
VHFWGTSKTFLCQSMSEITSSRTAVSRQRRSLAASQEVTVWKYCVLELSVIAFRSTEVLYKHQLTAGLIPLGKQNPATIRGKS